jgi:hypothetical protein
MVRRLFRGSFRRALGDQLCRVAQSRRRTRYGHCILPRTVKQCISRRTLKSQIGGVYLLQRRSHNLGAVVDSQHNVGDTCSSESLDLVQDHRLVCEFDEGLGKREGLVCVRAILAIAACWRAVAVRICCLDCIPVAVAVCRSRRRE